MSIFLFRGYFLIFATPSHAAVTFILLTKIKSAMPPPFCLRFSLFSYIFSI